MFGHYNQVSSSPYQINVKADFKTAIKKIKKQNRIEITLVASAIFSGTHGSRTFQITPKSSVS